MVADHGSTAFTSARFFYLVEDNELAVYRARLPEVSIDLIKMFTC